jgi:hypothetical protein
MRVQVHIAKHANPCSVTVHCYNAMEMSAWVARCTLVLCATLLVVIEALVTSYHACEHHACCD